MLAGMKEQLALLESSDKELEAVELAVSLALEASRNDVGRRFLLLKEEERRCFRRLHEAADMYVKKVRCWRKKKQRVGAKTANALFKVLQVPNDENVMERCSLTRQCIENNIMSLLILMHKYPWDACTYPKVVRDASVTLILDPSAYHGIIVECKHQSSVLTLQWPCDIIGSVRSSVVSTPDLRTCTAALDCKHDEQVNISPQPFSNATITGGSKMPLVSGHKDVTPPRSFFHASDCTTPGDGGIVRQLCVMIPDSIYSSSLFKLSVLVSNSIALATARVLQGRRFGIPLLSLICNLKTGIYQNTAKERCIVLETLRYPSLIEYWEGNMAQSAGVLMTNCLLSHFPSKVERVISVLARDNLSNQKGIHIQYKIPQIYLCVGSRITVLVTESCGHDKFIAQPYTPELIQLMKAMRKHYEYSDRSEASLIEFHVGDTCCALSIEDKCWYRAKILRIFPYSGLCDNWTQCNYLVRYVDYGNIEQVCGTHICALPMKFCQLPSQALSISICEDQSWYLSKRLPSEMVGSIVGVYITSCHAPNTFVVRVQNSSTLGKCPVSEIFCSGLSLPHVQFPFQAVVAHVNSLTDFYVHKLDKDAADRMNQLETEMYCYYSNKSNHHEINPKQVNSRKICCVYSVTCGMYCRGVFLQRRVGPLRKVQLIDYGHVEEVALNNILELPPHFLHYPVCSIHCKLIINEDELACERYKECNFFFKEMTTCMKLFKVQGVATHSPKSDTFSDSWNRLFYVDLYELSDGGDVSITQYFLRRRNPNTDVSLSTGGGRKACDWDPMLADYLSTRNKYSIDDEDVESAVHGYSDSGFASLLQGIFQRKQSMDGCIISNWEMMKAMDSCSQAGAQDIAEVPQEAQHCMPRTPGAISSSEESTPICRYYGAGRRCFAGQSCKFLHICQVIDNVKLLPAHRHSPSLLNLPNLGDFVLLIITAVISLERVFAQMPFGSNTLTMEGNEQCPALKLDTLLRDMSNYYSHQVFDEDCEFIIDGEVVATCKGDCWYRAKVLQCNERGVVLRQAFESRDCVYPVIIIQVFNVDYGDVSTVFPSEVRIMRDEFMILPFQVVECVIRDTSIFIPSIRSLVRQVTDSVVVAEVVAKCNQQLEIKLHCQHSCNQWKLTSNSIVADQLTFRPG